MQKAISILRNDNNTSIEQVLIDKANEEAKYYENIVKKIYKKLENSKTVAEFFSTYDNIINELPKDYVKVFDFDKPLDLLPKIVEKEENELRRSQEKINRTQEQQSEHDVREVEENSNRSIDRSNTKTKSKAEKQVNTEVAKATEEKEQIYDKENNTITHLVIEKGSIPDFDNVKDLKNWIIDNIDLIGNVNIKSNNKTIQFSKSNVSRSLKGTQRSEVKKDSYSKLKTLVENSVFGNIKKVDERHKGKVKEQELYYNVFTYSNDTYGIEIIVDIPLQETTPNTYAGHKIKIMKAPTATGISSNELTSNRLGADTISINDIKALFNPDVKNSEQTNTIQTRKTDKGIELYSLDTKEKIYKINQEVLNNSDNVSSVWNYKTEDFNTLIENLGITDVIDDVNNFALIFADKLGLTSDIQKLIEKNAKELQISSFKSDNKTYGKFGNNTIKINKAIADKLPVFSMTVSHEYWHSIQHLFEKEILNIPESQRTQEQIEFLNDMKESENYYKEVKDYFRKYPKVKKILNNLSKMKVEKRKEYINKLNNIDYTRYEDFVKKILPKYDLLNIENQSFDVGNVVAKGYNNGQYNGKIFRRDRESNLSGNKISRYFGWNRLRRGRRRARSNTEEELSDYSYNIPDDIDEILPKIKKPSDKVIQKIITPISTRLESISPRIKHAVRKFELDSALTENKYAETVKPFIDNLSKMPEADYAKYDLALKNGNVEEISQLNQKYNIVKEFENVKSLLDEIREKALNVGFNIGYVSDYFPRKVINSVEYLEYLSKNSSFIKEKLAELDPKGTIKEVYWL